MHISMIIVLILFVIVLKFESPLVIFYGEKKGKEKCNGCIILVHLHKTKSSIVEFLETCLHGTFSYSI